MVTQPIFMLRCPSCGSPYDEAEPECPGCRKARAQVVDPSRERGRTPQAKHAPRLVVRADRLRPFLYAVLFLLAGAVGSQVAVNLATGNRWYDSPVAVVTVLDHSVIRPRAAAPVLPRVEEHVLTGDFPRALELVSLSNELDVSTNEVAWRGAVRNTSAVSVQAAQVGLTGHDDSGREVISRRVLLTPNRLNSGQQSWFEIRIASNVPVKRWRLSGFWYQSVQSPFGSYSGPMSAAIE